MPQTHPVQGEWTVEEMWRLPDDGNRYEVIDGVLFVTPSPRLLHQAALQRLDHALFACIEGHVAGILLRSPADIVFSATRAVQPDLFVAPFVGGRPPRDWQEIQRLLLAVEVLSPSTAATDRGVKRRLYQQHADEYWIVDLDARLIERWRPGDERPEILDGTLTWRPKGAEAPLELDLPAFFSEVWDG